MTNIPKELILKQMELGPLANFLYFIGDAKTKEIAVVDPAWNVDHLCEQAKKNGYTIKAVFLTHGHPDHVNGLEEMLKRHDVPAYISKHEAPFYKPIHKNIVEIDNGKKLKIGNCEFECILAPGHTPGCQCFRYKNVLITGDVLFIDGCGRCDLPGGSAKMMYRSLYQIILKLPDDTLIFPGHNYGPLPFATLAEQKKTNPYLQASSEEDFLYQRMGM
ncbi:MAG TPA: MBL fold metallo-hydrolase [Candidatus Omnitrophota bacterium]|nr:MBL fold metallo-hydrolase [Candidatus Omnitrophota bacterium]